MTDYEKACQQFTTMQTQAAQASQQQAQMTAVQQSQMMQQWAQPSPQISMGQSLSGTNYTITTTGNTPLYQKEYEVSRLVKRAKNGYFFIITVDATDNVFFRVWKGGWFPYLVAKTFKKTWPDIDGNKSTWNSVTKRSHLPATLGSAYEKIDEAITGDMEDRDHDAYVKELLTTKPENLKMIGGLEKLAEGDVEVEEVDPNAGSSHSVGGYSYSNNMAISGNGVISTQPGNVLSFNSSSGPGDITGVDTLEAEKIVLNGTDLAETISEKVKEATDQIVLTLADMEAEVNAP